MPGINCYLCNEKMKKEAIDIKTGWGKYELKIKGLEPYVCPNCNEKVYSREEMLLIQNLSKCLSLKEANTRPKVLNIEDIIDLLKENGGIIFEMIKEGRLKPVKKGGEWKFDRKDIEAILCVN